MQKVLNLRKIYLTKGEQILTTIGGFSLLNVEGDTYLDLGGVILF